MVCRLGFARLVPWLVVAVFQDPPAPGGSCRSCRRGFPSPCAGYPVPLETRILARSHPVSAFPLVPLHVGEGSTTRPVFPALVVPRVLCGVPFGWWWVSPCARPGLRVPAVSLVPASWGSAPGSAWSVETCARSVLDGSGVPCRGVVTPMPLARHGRFSRRRWPSRCWWGALRLPGSGVGGGAPRWCARVVFPRVLSPGIADWCPPAAVPVTAVVVSPMGQTPPCRWWCVPFVAGVTVTTCPVFLGQTPGAYPRACWWCSGRHVPHRCGGGRFIVSVDGGERANHW